MFKITNFTATCAIVLTSVLGTGVNEANAQNNALVVVFDLGDGGDIFRNGGYARVASKKVSEIVENIALGNGDTLTLMSFGDIGQNKHFEVPELNRQITFAHRGAKPADVPGYLTSLLSNYGKFDRHAASNLMARLPNLAREIQCDKRVTVIMLSNGREIGDFINGNFRLSNVPDVASMCGSIHFVGLWIEDPDPSKGFGAAGPALFEQLGYALGFADVHIH